MSTEIFEGFNGVWRLCSILSNHHAPSRDIALNIANMDRFKYLASGGQWVEDNEQVKAGIQVRLFLESREELQANLGWVSDNKRKPGALLI